MQIRSNRNRLPITGVLPALTLMLAAVAPVLGDNGVTDKTIVLGQPAALKGPAANLGTGMQTGLNAAFAQINKAGGVKGRTIELKSVNDGYEPERSKAATQALIEGDKVFAIIGAVGTPTARAALPVCESAKVPFIGAFTGASALRENASPVVVNFRASYDQETESWAKYLADEKGYKNIACFYQNDAFGEAGLKGITKALEKRGMKLAATGKFERNTVAISDGLTAVAASNPDAVVIVAPYKPSAEFIKAAKANAATKNAQFVNISFVGTEALVEALGSDGEGVIVSQVVPSPWDTSVPLVKEYQQAMKDSGNESQIGYISFEGYAVGRYFSQIVSSIQGDITRESFLKASQSIAGLDLGGLKLTTGPSDNQASDQVFMTRLTGGKAVPMNSAVTGVGESK